MTVHVAGDGIHLRCDSPCEITGDVTWSKDNAELDRASISTANHGLVLLNVTHQDHGIYTCSSGGVTLAVYNVHVPSKYLFR